MRLSWRAGPRRSKCVYTCDEFPTGVKTDEKKVGITVYDFSKMCIEEKIKRKVKGSSLKYRAKETKLLSR